VQTTGLAGAVDDATRADLAQEWRSVTSEDTSVLTKHPTAPTLPIYTLLADESDAQNECNRQLALRKVQRDRYPIVVRATEDTNTLDLGDVVSQQHERFDLATAKKFLIVGVAPNGKDQSIGFELWGGT
jgi:hypothetical protein